MAAASAPKQQRKKRQRKPKHVRLTRAFCFAMDVKPAAAAKLFQAIETLRALRNDLAVLLRQDRQANRARREAGEPTAYLGLTELCETIKARAAADPALAAIHSQVRQNVAQRLLEGTRRWLEALAEGDRAVRPPKPKPLKKHRSLCYPQHGNGARISGGKVFLSGLGLGSRQAAPALRDG